MQRRKEFQGKQGIGRILKHIYSPDQQKQQWNINNNNAITRYQEGKQYILFNAQFSSWASVGVCKFACNKLLHMCNNFNGGCGWINKWMDEHNFKTIDLEPVKYLLG